VRNLLVVAYSFPPSSVIATHRTLAFVKYLERSGWRSSVLCAENPSFPQRDDGLLAQIPATTRVIRTLDRDLLSRLQPMYRWVNGSRSRSVPPVSSDGEEALGPWRAFKRSVALRLRPPGRSPGWYRSTLREGRRLVRQQNIEAIYSSGPPWSAHMAALKLAREYELPWVADFRDQWVADPFDVPQPPRELIERDRRDEARVMQRADFVVCVVDTLSEVLRTRYPERRAEEIVTIMNGFDPAILGGISFAPPAEEAEASRLRFVHTGHFYGKRRVEPFLEALNAWLAAEPAMAPRIEVCLLGGLGEYLAEIRARVAAAGDSPYVRIEPDTSHHGAVQRQAEASVLLLVGYAGPGSETQMSGKIFEYLAVRRPILALAPPASPVGNVLRAAGVKHWIVSPDDHEGLVTTLRAIGAEWREGKLAGPQSAAALAAFDRSEQTKQLAEVLERATTRRRGKIAAHGQ
jgi:glycosyl transferase family 4